MKFFISSTYSDLKNIRQVAINTIESLISGVTGQIAAMEYFAASPEDSKSVCLEELRRSDIVIGIYANRFGWTSDDGRSMTEIEFDEAKVQGKPILAFVENHIDDNAEEQQKRFLHEKVLQPDITCAKFDLDKPEDFAKRLNDTLKEYFKDLEGYSYHSVWDEINELKQKIEKEDDYPRLLPYGENEEDNALENIVESVGYLSKMADDLRKENDIVYDIAHYYWLRWDEDPTVDPDIKKEFENNKNSMLKNIKNYKQEIVRCYDWTVYGIPNHCTSILMAVNYLKLCRVQKRLLTESWSESLRQDILRIKAFYVDIIENRSGLID